MGPPAPLHAPSGPWPRRAALAILAGQMAFLAAGGGCNDLIVLDPARRNAIAALGPEDPAVPVGPRHRAGQPCGTCHGEGGSADPFLYAGTVYRDPRSVVAMPDVEVAFIDEGGRRFVTKTNCAGNFYVKPGELPGTGPVWVSVRTTDLPYTMESPIHRESSCTACHRDPAGPASAGHVFLTDEAPSGGPALRGCGPADEEAR